jgi:hypothetical protein
MDVGSSNKIDSSKVGVDYLERLVEQTGYASALTAFSSALQTESLDPSEAFIETLSSKSHGVMLTSALIAERDSLYKPLYDKAGQHLAGFYSQDLPSLLGGDHAPAALYEMARRAQQSPQNLEDFEYGLTQIAASLKKGGALAGVKAEISSSAWVERHAEPARDLLKQVNVAPAAMKLGMLKDGALGRYLKAGLKLGAASAILAGLGVASIFGSNMLQSTDSISFVDISSRPVIETAHAFGKTETRRILSYGEINSAKVADFYLSWTMGQSIGDATKSLVSNMRVGIAFRTEKGEAGDEALCIVQTHQVAPVSADGSFYLFEDRPSAIADKNYADFYTQSHEADHCFNYFDAKENGTTDPGLYDNLYQSSLNEISSDLAAVLDYMRVTGKADIYTDCIRPYRIVSVNDLPHKTAWALDVILKDVDPVAISKKDKEDIPKITRFLMEKHFMAKDGSFSPGALSSRGSAELDKPAAQALIQEIVAARTLKQERYPELTARLKGDIQSTISYQHAKYAGVASQDVLAAAADGYSKLASDYKLDPLQTVTVKKAEVSPPLESFVTAYR